MKILQYIFIICFLIVPIMEHSGRTDKNGCHTEKSSGKKHCH